MQQDPVGDALPAFIGAPPYPRPQCRPPRRTMASMGVMAQIFCDAGDSGTQFTSATPPHPGLDGGFCSIRSLPSACRRRVAPLMVQFPRLVAMSSAGKSRTGPRAAQFPPFDGGEAAVRGSEAAPRGSEVTVRGSEVAPRDGAAPKSQTTSVTNADNGASWARWPALWTQRRHLVRRSHMNRRQCALTP